MVAKNLDRRLAATVHSHAGAFLLRLGLVALVLAVVGALVSQLNLKRDLHRLDAGMLSGAPEGNYHALVDDLSRAAAKDKGTLRNVTSAGSVENVSRLRAEKKTCDVAFGLAQDGSDWGAPGELELVGRLAKSESVFFLGKKGDDTKALADLRGAKIGIGPEGSGSARLARQLFGLPELAALGADLQTHPLNDALEMARNGRLDFVFVVIDEDTPWLASAMKDLQIAGIEHMDVLARRLPHFRTGRIGAGQFDAVKVIPPVDKRVLRVDTLVVGNGCASRSATLDLMTVIQRRHPDFIRHNKESPNATGLEVASAARGFFAEEGPELADEYVPWLVDVMPPANWAYIVMAVSLLFNAMGFGHRFRLWRIDASRVKLENEMAALFGPTTTLGDIERAKPGEETQALTKRARLEEIVHELEALANRARKQSLSVLVPMGQEMAYRYQEGVIYETIAVLRDFLRRAASI
jgi:TRAP-type uncharacterized transport system substrate-binding protein